MFVLLEWLINVWLKCNKAHVFPWGFIRGRVYVTTPALSKPQLPIFDFEKRNFKKKQQQKINNNKNKKKTEKLKEKKEERRGKITCIYLSDLSVQTRLQIKT